MSENAPPVAEPVLQTFYLQYFARYPAPLISNDMILGDFWRLFNPVPQYRGPLFPNSENCELFDPESIAELRCLKEKLVVAKIKEVRKHSDLAVDLIAKCTQKLEEWACSRYSDGFDLQRALDEVPRFDVLPALDEYTSFFLGQLKMYQMGSLPCNSLVYKPLKSEAFAFEWSFPSPTDCGEVVEGELDDRERVQGVEGAMGALIDGAFDDGGRVKGGEAAVGALDDGRLKERKERSGKGSGLRIILPARKVLGVAAQTTSVLGSPPTSLSAERSVGQRRTSRLRFSAHRGEVECLAEVEARRRADVIMQLTRC
ncbi:hypothetical protein GYMLUDRAFT_253398 [Collybiopsis luxurians FD-317 M1]|uniref:Uncharacterized protein n=1 Tax=Collybiopsis luxurians FD-317 M1 TaxID=944289 RepID=A0A0D0BWR3_9AGAR|nr:hypothetical protein GYMLUDRAFT_253398 [Collybiopsis luxurians FD-317 M1]